MQNNAMQNLIWTRVNSLKLCYKNIWPGPWRVLEVNPLTLRQYYRTSLESQPSTLLASSDSPTNTTPIINHTTTTDVTRLEHHYLLPCFYFCTVFSVLYCVLYSVYSIVCTVYKPHDYHRCDTTGTSLSTALFFTFVLYIVFSVYYLVYSIQYSVYSMQCIVLCVQCINHTTTTDVTRLEHHYLLPCFYFCTVFSVLYCVLYSVYSIV